MNVKLNSVECGIWSGATLFTQACLSQYLGLLPYCIRMLGMGNWCVIRVTSGQIVCNIFNLSVSRKYHGSRWGPFFWPKCVDVFLFLHKNVCYGYPLEVSHFWSLVDIYFKFSCKNHAVLNKKITAYRQKKNVIFWFYLYFCIFFLETEYHKCTFRGLFY